MADPILIVGPSPHRKRGISVEKRQYLMILALLPGLLAALVVHGLPVLGLLGLAIGTAVLVEAVSQYLMKQPIEALDGHAIGIGILFVMLVPVNVPWWLVVLGVALSVFLAKQIYGGNGNYPFHPVLVGYLIMLLSWPHHLAPIGGVTVGMACPYAVAAGGLYLMAVRAVKVWVPIFVVLGVVLFGAMFHALYPNTVALPCVQLITGNVLLGAFFLATDATSSPANRLAQMLYGLFIGGMILLVRVYGQWMEVVPFAVMLGNMISPLLDRLVHKPLKLEKSHA